MPTAAKLIAAILLAILTMIVSEQLKLQLPEGTVFGQFTFLNGLIALGIGWRFIGGASGGGFFRAINTGLTGVVVLISLLSFYHATRQMILASMQNSYSTLAGALQDIPRRMVDNGLYLIDQEILLTLGIGGVVIGLATEAARRRWR